MAEWLGRRTSNPEDPGSSPALTAIWSLFTDDPDSTARPHLKILFLRFKCSAPLALCYNHLPRVNKGHLFFYSQ